VSIIYDALQKTQRNREYLKFQNAITPHKPPRRNIKWMVLGPLFLILSAGLGALATFYWPAIDLVQRSQKAAQKPAVAYRPSPIHQAVQTPRIPSPVVPKPAEPQPLEPQSSAHLWVTEATPSLGARMAESKPNEATQTTSMQHEIASAINQGKFILNGVMISGAERIALINNQPLHIGDVIDGMKIISIEFNAITLMKDQKMVEMKVPV